MQVEIVEKYVVVYKTILIYFAHNKTVNVTHNSNINKDDEESMTRRWGQEFS